MADASKANQEKVQSEAFVASERIARHEDGAVLHAEARVEFWRVLIGFLILQLAIAVGWIAATGGHLADGWNTVFMAGAAAALGFGEGVLCWGYFRESGGEGVEEACRV